MSGFSPFAPGPRGEVSESWFDWTLALLIAVNLFPLVMAFQGYFDVSELLIAYWLELLVVALVVLIKLITAHYPPDVPRLMPLILVILFSLPYTMCCILLGRLVFFITDRDPNDALAVLLNPFGQGSLITIWLAMLCFSHGLPLVTRWFLRGERQAGSPLSEAASAFGRAFPLLGTLFLGTTLGVCFDNNQKDFALGPAFVLVAGKIAFDVIGHFMARQRARRRAESYVAPAPPRYAPIPPEAYEDD
jgi:hypothetical protein